MKIPPSGFLTLLFAMILIGCQTIAPRSAFQSGFLGDYSRLREDQFEDQQVRWIFVRPDFDFGAFNRLILDPVDIFASEEFEGEDLESDELVQLSSRFYAGLRQAFLDAGFEITDEVAPGTLRVRAALTEADRAITTLRAITSVPPFRLYAQAASLAFGTTLFAGQASVEMEMIDAESGEQLVAVVDRRVGSSSPLNALNTWGDVENAIDHWLELLNLRLREHSDRTTR